MATHSFSKSGSAITINGMTNDVPGAYTLSVDSVNNILVVKADNGTARVEVHTVTDTVTVNGAPFTGTAAELKTLLLSNVFVSSSGDPSIIEALPKVYAAALSQSGTDDPVATVFSNTIGNIVWSRTGSGEYVGTLEGAFPAGKVACFSGYNNGNTGNSTNLDFILGSKDNGNEVFLGVFTPGSGFAGNDDQLINLAIEIRVYP